MKQLLIILFFIPSLLFGQYDKMLDELDDSQTEAQDGKLALRFFNADNGQPVPDATIKIEGIGDFQTDMQGRVIFDIPTDARYACSFSKEGFIEAIYRFEVIAGTIFSNRFVVCPILDFGSLRVVLQWNKKPADLDLHLIKQGEYHISYQDMHKSNDGNGKLDLDDRDGFGPETITIKDLDEKAVYTCYVKNYTDKDRPNNRKLSESGASVLVYGNNALLNTFEIQKDKKGTSWMVFEIVNGKVKPILNIGNQY